MRSNLRALYRAGSGSHALLLLDPMIVHSRNVHFADRDLILDEVQVCVQPLQDLGRILSSTRRIDHQQPNEDSSGNQCADVRTFRFLFKRAAASSAGYSSITLACSSTRPAYGFRMCVLHSRLKQTPSACNITSRKPKK